MDTDLFAEEFVLGAVAVAGVAEDRVANVGEVTADLMFSAGLGLDFDEGETIGRVATDGYVDFAVGEFAVVGFGFLNFRRVFFGAEGSVDFAGPGSPSADHGQVGFLRAVLCEGGLCPGEGFFVESEEERTAGWAVESVAGVDFLAKLVAQKLEGKDVRIGGELGAVHEEARRFVDRYIIGVLVENREVHV